MKQESSARKHISNTDGFLSFNLVNSVLYVETFKPSDEYLEGPVAYHSFKKIMDGSYSV